MSERKGSQISYEEAMEQVNNWINYRSSESVVASFLAEPHHYIIKDDFDLAKFPDHNPHAYFGLKIITHPGEEPKMELALLFIPLSNDKVDFSGERYVYRAPYVKAVTAVNPTQNQSNQQGNITYSEAVHFVNEWNEKGESWVDYMVNESSDGVTIVSDVPWGDITHLYQQREQIYVYLGMRDNIEVSQRLGLVFFDGELGENTQLIADNITTPKPPFGTGQESDYQLMHSYFNQ